MALIKCEECGKEISDKATACIHCGCPVNIKEITEETNTSISQTQLEKLVTTFYEQYPKNMFIAASHLSKEYGINNKIANVLMNIEHCKRVIENTPPTSSWNTSKIEVAKRNLEKLKIKLEELKRKTPIVDSFTSSSKVVFNKNVDKISACKELSHTYGIKLSEAKEIVDREYSHPSTPVFITKKSQQKYETKQRIKENRSNAVACCPKCGSTSLSANKKGFGLLKGAAGVATFGAYGVVTAGIGKNKVIVTCLNCGHQFKPGK